MTRLITIGIASLLFFCCAYAQTFKGVFQFHNDGTGKVLYCDSGKKIYTHASGSEDYQNWEINYIDEDEKGKFFTIKNVKTDVYLTQLWGNIVGLKGPATSALSHWYIKVESNETVQIINRYTDDSLDGDYNTVFPTKANKSIYPKWKIVKWLHGDESPKESKAFIWWCW